MAVPATFIPIEKTHDLVPELRTDVEKGKAWGSVAARMNLSAVEDIISAALARAETKGDDHG